MNTGYEYWTHPSVQVITQLGDPVKVITEKARTLIFEALQKGWSGPPYDPFELAELLNIETTPSSDVLDACIIAKKPNKYLIEYNPNHSIGRIHYSIAHEISHTLFPDCGDEARSRKKENASRNDNWQLEMLCNLAAAEILMPIGSFPELKKETLNIDTLMDWRKKYNVSSEALLLRIVKLSDEPCFMFTCSKRNENTQKAKYYIDYAVPSKNFHVNLNVNMPLPYDSCVSECTAIGYTAKNTENWARGTGSIDVECVGLPSYSNCIFPRVAGLGVISEKSANERNEITYVKGDATKPRGSENKILTFIINDKANSWGAGFAKQMQNKWPLLLEEFQYWKQVHRPNFSLGNVFTVSLQKDITAVLMIANTDMEIQIVPECVTKPWKRHLKKWRQRQK